MKSATKAANTAIEALIQKALAKGDINQAEQLAESVNRKLKNTETDTAITIALKSKKFSTWNLRSIVSGRKVSKVLLEKVVAKAVKEGNIYTAFDIATQLNRPLQQAEVDGIYRVILKSKNTPEQKGNDIDTVLWCDIRGGREQSRLRMDLNPSAAVANKLMKLCLEHNLEKACRDLLWLRRGRKDRINQKLTDAFVTRIFKAQKEKDGRYSLVDTPAQEVFLMASPPVVQNVLKELVQNTKGAFNLLRYGSFDPTGEILSAAITKLCKDAADITDWIDKNKYLRETTTQIVGFVKDVTPVLSALKEWVTVNEAAEEHYNNCVLAYNLKLPEDIRDSIFEGLHKKNLFYPSRDLYIKRGGPDSIRDWVIAKISVPGSVSIGDHFHPDDVFKMGGTEAINKLIADMLDQKNIYLAIHVAEKDYTPVKTREKVITEAVTHGWAYHSIEKMLLANHRKPIQSEIDQVFQNMIKKVSDNESLYLEYALDMLPHKPTKGLEEPLVAYLKKKKRWPELINLLKAVGRESEIEKLI